jgi:uncharacterized protein YgiM (DUF1202 family)
MERTQRLPVTSLVTLAFAVSAIAACSAQSPSEEVEEGYGELESGGYVVPASELATEDAVSDDEIDDVDPVADEDLVALDDGTALDTGDDSPDVEMTEADQLLDAPALHGVPLAPTEPLDAEACKAGKYPNYLKGAQLVTTEYLNLRTGPSTSKARITVLKPGAALVVLGATCGSAWAHVKTANGATGWSAVAYLRAKAKGSKPPAFLSIYSPQRGKSLANASWKQGKGKKSSGSCLRGVRLAISASISPGFYTGSPGASQFGQYARSHRAWMAQRHLQVYASSEAGAPKPSQFPVGTIMVYSAGRCGFNAKWGHVEVVVNKSTACSDFCRSWSPSKCAPDTVIIPRK